MGLPFLETETNTKDLLIIYKYIEHQLNNIYYKILFAGNEVSGILHAQELKDL